MASMSFRVYKQLTCVCFCLNLAFTVDGEESDHSSIGLFILGNLLFHARQWENRKKSLSGVSGFVEIYCVNKKIWLTIPCRSDNSGYTFKFNKPLKYLQNNSIIHMIHDCTPSTKAQKLYR